MTAKTTQRRGITAREGAEKLGVSERTVRRIRAEPRADFEGRARVRRERVVELREQGLTYKEMGIPMGSVGKALYDARKRAAEAGKAAAETAPQG